jgi:hypothetical protein
MTGDHRQYAILTSVKGLHDNIDNRSIIQGTAEKRGQKAGLEDWTG